MWQIEPHLLSAFVSVLAPLAPAGLLLGGIGALKMRAHLRSVLHLHAMHCGRILYDLLLELLEVLPVQWVGGVLL